MSVERIDMLGADLLPPLPAAFLTGTSLELLEPLGITARSGTDASDLPSVDRRAIAQALAVTNAAYGHPAAAEMATKLAQPETRVIATGQQPGLLGGPLYTLSKAVAAMLWVERLEAAGQPSVAVFWVATEDHDYREVASAVFQTSDGPRSFELGDDPSPLTPVGMRTLGPEMARLLAELRQANGGDRWTDWIDRIAGWYRPDARFGEAFSRLIVGLMGERCPLMLDSMLPELKQAQRPWLRRLVEEREEIEAAFRARDREITAAGFDLQVKPTTGASPLFFLRGQERRRIEWRADDRVGLRGADGSERPIDWLLEAIEENPAVVSPGVMARTALQDATLGTSILVFGPGELSYIPQVAPLYAHLGLRPPRVSVRPQALVLARHQVDKLPSLDIGLRELIAPSFDIDRSLSGGKEEELIAPIRSEIEAELQKLKVIAEGVDSNLGTPWEKTSKQIGKALDAFSGRLSSAVARQRDVDRRRLQDLRDSCRPLGTLQERILCTAHFPGKYGDRFVDALFEQLELDPRSLQVITV